MGIEVGMRLEVDVDEKTGCIRLRPLNTLFSQEGEEWEQDEVEN